MTFPSPSPSRSPLVRRLQRLQSQLSIHQLDALLISSPANLTYLTGIYPISHLHREAFIIVTSSYAKLISSPLGSSVFAHLTHLKPSPLSKKHPLSSHLNQLTQPRQYLGIESEDLRVNEYNQLTDKLHALIKPTSGILTDLRLNKDKQEIACLTTACRLTVKAWHQLQPQIKPGVTEQQLANLLLHYLQDSGSEGFPIGFQPIIASGPNSATPHHSTSNRQLQNNEPVLIDFGCTVNGYASDFTRTIFIGQPTPKFLQVESIVKSAYQQALKALAISDSPQTVDQLTRDFISGQGFGKKFIHNTGHGLGLEIHEPPHFHYQYPEPHMLKPGMVVAIEPGVYLPGKFGYRFENTILITSFASKIKTLTQTHQSKPSPSNR